MEDANDLPNDEPYNHDLEIAGHGEDAVLTDEEQNTFIKHQNALHQSHTYYRPHETATHRAFPVSVLIAIIVLCDFHSTFQLALGSATWSISYHHNYKKILTSIILAFSLSCNITAGIMISVGNRMSRKTAVVEALMRQAVTEEALRRKQDADKYKAEKKAEQEKEQEKELARATRDENGGQAAELKQALLGTSVTGEKIVHKHGLSRRQSEKNVPDKEAEKEERQGLTRSATMPRPSLDAEA